jgi:hypothetical protein
VQRRSWSGGRSEPDLSAAWLARLVRSCEPERGVESFEKMMRLSPLAHDFCSQSMERKNLSSLYYCFDLIIVPIWNVQHRLSTALPIAICNLFFLNLSPRCHLFSWAKNQEGVRQHG